MDTVGKPPVERHVEQLPEDRHSVAGAGGEKGLELALRQQHDLAELRRPVAEQRLHRFIDSLDLALGQHLAGRVLVDGVEVDAGDVEQPSLVHVLGLAIATFDRAHLLGPAHDVVALVADFEHQRRLGQHLRIGVIGAQRARVLLRARGLAEQRERHRAEDGGFAGAGLAVDAEQAAVDGGAEVHHLPARVGAERLQRQSQRSHAAASFALMAASSAAMMCVSASLGGRPRLKARNSATTSAGSAKAEALGRADFVSSAVASRS